MNESLAAAGIVCQVCVQLSCGSIKRPCNVNPCASWIWSNEITNVARSLAARTLSIFAPCPLLHLIHTILVLHVCYGRPTFAQPHFSLLRAQIVGSGVVGERSPTHSRAGVRSSPHNVDLPFSTERVPMKSLWWIKSCSKSSVSPRCLEPYIPLSIVVSCSPNLTAPLHPD